jgi:hypothetical protein
VVVAAAALALVFGSAGRTVAAIGAWSLTALAIVAGGTLRLVRSPNRRGVTSAMPYGVFLAGVLCMFPTRTLTGDRGAIAFAVSGGVLCFAAGVLFLREALLRRT